MPFMLLLLCSAACLLLGLIHLGMEKVGVEGPKEEGRLQRGRALHIT